MIKREDVEWLAGRMSTNPECEAMLRALADERDAAVARADLTWFWEIVDCDGMAGLPSDERGALAMLVKRAAERDAMRRERNAMRVIIREAVAWLDTAEQHAEPEWYVKACTALAGEARDE